VPAPTQAGELSDLKMPLQPDPPTPTPKAGDET
jgi:hypothetical protein